MARETKVGLLVGLAFIICFAIILANHGQRGQLLETVPPVIVNQSSKPAGQPIRSVGQPAQHIGRENTVEDPRFVHAASRSTPPRVDRDLTDTTSPIQRHHQGIASGPEVAVVDEATNERIRQLENQISELLAEKTTTHPAGTFTTLPAKELTLAATPISDPVSMADRLPEFSGGDGTTTSSQRHVVGSGDTLSRIAEKYYGNKSARVVAMIVEANKSAIKDPDRIPLGAELVLPADPKSGATAIAAKNPVKATSGPARNEQARASGKPTAASPKKDTPRERAEPGKKEGLFRWYSVKKNDRYVSIARQQLGDEGRWKEIFELNKEKFPKEGMIREGVRIKLPASEGVADARGTRR